MGFLRRLGDQQIGRQIYPYRPQKITLCNILFLRGLPLSMVCLVSHYTQCNTCTAIDLAYIMNFYRLFIILYVLLIDVSCELSTTLHFLKASNGKSLHHSPLLHCYWKTCFVVHSYSHWFSLQCNVVASAMNNILCYRNVTAFG